MAKELFERIDKKISTLIDDVLSGRIGLPDLQRPFVWQDAKVRDLFDSMMKGFPVGYIMFWSAPTNYENTKTIGNNDKQYKRPDDLVIDGQQRLTSLLSAMTGTPVKNKEFKEAPIRLSFGPLSKEFFVWTSATGKNSQLVNDIAEVYKADAEHTFPMYRKKLIRKINEGREKNNEDVLTEEQEISIEDNLNALLDLKQYTIPTLRILSSADEEDVAEIFRRVNSGGQNLNENNFVETLLAVYDNDIHDKIQRFCSESRVPAKRTSYNQIIDLSPSHVIRVCVAYGFRRARLKYGYKLLRGKNLETGVVSEETRKENFDIFKNSLDIVTDLNNWHSYLNLFASAGYLNKDFISSTYVVVYSYVLYLMGKHIYKVPAVQLQKTIIRWIFMSTITSFYSNSSESTVERQLADLRGIKDSDAFVAYLDKTINSVMSDNFFQNTLLTDLTTSSSVSPFWYGYIASLNILATPTLFGTSPLSKYLVLGSDGMKKSIDKHHIFPKAYLESIGITDDRDRNQIANYTYLDYQTNIDISDNPPASYVEKYRKQLGKEAFEETCDNNALPYNFDSLDYFEFLKQRRERMAKIIKLAYERL